MKKLNQHVETLLKRIGLETFINYYDKFQVGIEFDFDKNYTLNSARTKKSNGKRIFREGLQKIALEQIILSNRVSDSIVERARELLIQELNKNKEITIKFSTILKTNLNRLDDLEIIKLYSDVVKELKDRQIIKTSSITGSLGERLMVDLYNKNGYNLVEEPNSNKDYDATDNTTGKTYQIKAVTQSATGKISNVESYEDKKFDYLVVLKLDEAFRIENLYELSWSDFWEMKRPKGQHSYYIMVNNTLDPYLKDFSK